MRIKLTPRICVRRGAAAFALAFATAIVLLCPAGASAQQPAGATLAVQSVDAAQYPQLTATVSVLDASGVPLPALQPAAFHAFDGDTPLDITSVASAQDGTVPLSVVLVIDTSGSMAGDAIARARQAATDFVNALQPGDSVALVAFSDDVSAPAGSFTKDHAAVNRAIAGLQADGNTALYRAVSVAVLNAARAPDARRAVVLLTDGQDFPGNPADTNTGSLDAATRSGVPFFTIGFGDAPDVAYLQALSSAAHGSYSAATTANIGDVYNSIGALLRNQYVLTIRDAHAADGAAGTLRVAVDAAGAQPSGTASFTRGLAPAVVASPPASGTATAPAAATSGSSSSSVVLIAVVVLVLAAIAAAVGVLLVRRAREAQRQRERERDAGRQSDETVPLPTAAPLPAAPPVEAHGRLVLRTPDGEDRVYELGAGPVVIGTSKRDANVVLPEDRGVAPEHARIWLRDGHYVLHSTAGMGRRTLVAGREAAWVTLDPGDEIQVGPYRFLFEDEAAVTAERTP